jgi:hypothetical protein
VCILDESCSSTAMVTKAVLGVADVSVRRDFKSRCASAARSRNLLSEGGCATCKGTAGTVSCGAAVCGVAGVVYGEGEAAGVCVEPGWLPLVVGGGADCRGAFVCGVGAGAVGVAVCVCFETLTTRGRVKTGDGSAVCARVSSAGANTTAVKLMSRKERLFIFKLQG